MLVDMLLCVLPLATPLGERLMVALLLRVEVIVAVRQAVVEWLRVSLLQGEDVTDAGALREKEVVPE